MAAQFPTVLQEETAKGVFQAIISVIKRTSRFAVDEVKVRGATETYVDNYIRRFCTIKILGMSEPVPLSDLYTKVEVVSPSYLIKDQIIDELEKSFRSSKRSFHSNLKRIDGLEIANQNSKLNVLGAPGSGKSTFLRRIGLECLITYGDPSLEVFSHKCIPVLIELKRLRNEPVDLKQLIQNEFEIAGFPESNTFLNRALNNGMLLLLLDGLDEVPESKLSSVLQHLKDFTDKYHKNRFITSCRTAFYKNYLSGFTDVEISSFDDLQINQFVNNWFVLDKVASRGTVELFTSLLFKEGNEATVELARTPLLLAYLCMTFDESQRFPSNRASLYRQALLILMQKWAAEKRIHNEDIYQDLNSELETEMLAYVSARFYVSNKIFFFEQDLMKEIRIFLAKRISNTNLDIQKVIEAIEVQQGILVERSPSIYSFSHLTIQEYLTAHYFNSPKRIHQLINNHLFDNRWREVFLLLVGIGDPNDTMLLMLDFLTDYAQSNELLSETALWIEKVVEVESESMESDAAKRAFLASLLIRYRRYDPGLFKEEKLHLYADSVVNSFFPALFDFFIAELGKFTPGMIVLVLDQVNNWRKFKKNIDKEKGRILAKKPTVPLSSMLHGSRHSYRQEVVAELYTALQVPSKLVNKRKSAYAPLVNYLKGYSLLIDCAKSSNLTSKDTWKSICNNFLK